MLLGIAVGLFASVGNAAPTFPPLTGRVVDEAHVLSPQVATSLTEKLAALESTTGRQVVVVTLSSLQGYEIEDYGYKLGRTWGIGEKGKNTGALLIVAPNERKVRIEVGYGLEPILTDALSSAILQRTLLPRFRAGDLEGGIVAGTDALITQLSLPDNEAIAQVAKANTAGNGVTSISPFAVIIIIVFLLMVVRSLFGRGRGGLASALPWIILGSLGNRGGWSDGGGGFSGGGGSFGGGGSSGSW